MELNEFISNSLVQIAQGIEGANDKLTESSALVSPRRIFDIPTEQRVGFHKDARGELVPVTEIKFDVAVTVSEGTETRGGIGVAIGMVALGSQGKSNSADGSLSRLTFSIPMVLPHHNNT